MREHITYVYRDGGQLGLFEDAPQSGRYIMCARLPSLNHALGLALPKTPHSDLCTFSVCCDGKQLENIICHESRIEYHDPSEIPRKIMEALEKWEGGRPTI